MSKLHFTNDCDPDMTICELQHWLGKAEEILNKIENNSNPAYLKTMVDGYFKEQEYTDE